MSRWLEKSPQARCFCAPECNLCPGYRKCIVHSGADSRHRAFVVRLVGELADLREPVGSVGPGDDEWASRLQRAARRWLKVVEGSVKK